MGGRLRPEIERVHFAAIAAEIGLGYPFERLLSLFEATPSTAAVKSWSNDPMLHERHTRAFQSLPHPVTLLTTHLAWLMASLAMASGVVVGRGQRQRALA